MYLAAAFNSSMSISFLGKFNDEQNFPSNLLSQLSTIIIHWHSFWLNPSDYLIKTLKSYFRQYIQ